MGLQIKLVFRLRLLLRQDGNTIATVQVEGNRNDLDALTERVATTILEKLKLP